MKKNIVFLVFVLSVFINFPCLAKKFNSVLDEKMKNVSDIFARYLDGKIVENKYTEELYVCSKIGNEYCSGLLGHWYFLKGEYSSARALLINASNLKAEVYNYDLGYMYQHGLGVLQNDNKAIEYYKKCALLDNSDCAFNIGAIYTSKAYLSIKAFSRTKNHILVSKINYNLIRGYAWFKLSPLLSKNPIYLNDGHKTDLSKTNASIRVAVLEELKENLTMVSKLNESDKLAAQICSTISACKQ